MDDKELVELISSIPEEIVQDVLGYIDALQTKYNLELSGSDPQEDS